MSYQYLKPLVFFWCLWGNVHCQSAMQQDTAALPADRVAAARSTTGPFLSKAVETFGANMGSPIFLRAFKQEKQLELWIWRDSAWALFRTYAICKIPGEPGPKRKQGDLQVPEGVYVIDVFNPKSSFHLSLRINYPNQADRHFADPQKPGGEIYLHGGCASTGCLPLGDAAIEEVYLLALDAKNAGQLHIPVHLFPCRMRPENLQALLQAQPEHHAFWENLQMVYWHFEHKRRIPAISVDADGWYRMAEE